VPLANKFEAKAGFYLMKGQGRVMIGVGDDGVRRVLGFRRTPNLGVSRHP